MKNVPDNLRKGHFATWIHFDKWSFYDWARWMSAKPRRNTGVMLLCWYSIAKIKNYLETIYEKKKQNIGIVWQKQTIALVNQDIFLFTV